MDGAECLESLRAQYDGYRFHPDGPGEDDRMVYNPLSLLRALKERRLGSHWFQTGTPTFLVHHLRNGWTSRGSRAAPSACHHADAAHAACSRAWEPCAQNRTPMRRIRPYRVRKGARRLRPRAKSGAWESGQASTRPERRALLRTRSY